MPEFTELRRFSLEVPFSFSVSDDPAGFAEALDVGLAAAALPPVIRAEARRKVPDRIVLEEPITTRTAADRAFTAALIRVWNDTAE
ncbi:hypothetical protein [Microbacterium soli]